MGTLETTKTLAESYSPKSSESQTLEDPGGVPNRLPLGHGREPESRAPELVIPLNCRAPITAEKQAETLVGVERMRDLGLGFEDNGDVGSETSCFAIGDFVWGKIKSHPWWPGQVYDPSHASERAQKAQRRAGRGVLVAYFGDDTFAWCEPTQLKPFLPEFHQMARQSTGKSFTASVDAALEEIAKYLEVQMTCRCVEGEVRTRFENYQVTNLPVANYTASEFVEHVRDAAKDFAIVDMLEATMLRSWVLAFSRGKGWSDDPSVYHQRRKIADLVDKIDLDASPRDFVREDGEEESYFTESLAVKGPGSLEAKSHHKKKRRSMAALIAEMDLNAVEVSDSDEEKAETVLDDTAQEPKKEEMHEDVKGPNVENPSIVAEEASGSGKRERKKSKYLSPPYTNLGGYGKHLVSHKDAELETPEQFMEVSRAIGSPVLHECSFEGIQKEGDQKGPIYKIDSTSACELFSEFLATALNPLHLKWNRLAKTIRGFFILYRSSFYSSGSDFEAYQKHLSDSACCLNGKIREKGMIAEALEGSQPSWQSKKRKHEVDGGTRTELGDNIIGSSGRGKASERRKTRKDKTDAVTPSTEKGYSEQGTPSRKRMMKKDGANGGIQLDFGQDVSEHSVTGLKKRIRKSGADSRAPVPLSVEIVDGSTEGKSRGRWRRKTKDVVNGGTIAGLGDGFMNFSEGKIDNRESVTNGKGPLKVGHDFVDNLGAGKSGSGRKRRKSKAGNIGEAVVNLDLEIIGGSEKGKTGQKRKKKNETNIGSPAALLLTFCAGFTMPSKDRIITTFRKYGALVESETELLKESRSARVVFITSTDAEKAFNDRDRNVAFKPPDVTYRLRYLPGNSSSPEVPLSVTTPPLPYIRKSLERMILTLNEISPSRKDVGSSEGLKPEARENLVGEMQGLLKKVNNLLSGPAAGSSS